MKKTTSSFMLAMLTVIFLAGQTFASGGWLVHTDDGIKTYRYEGCTVVPHVDKLGSELTAVDLNVHADYLLIQYVKVRKSYDSGVSVNENCTSSTAGRLEVTECHDVFMATCCEYVEGLPVEVQESMFGYCD